MALTSAVTQRGWGCLASAKFLATAVAPVPLSARAGRARRSARLRRGPPRAAFTTIRLVEFYVWTNQRLALHIVCNRNPADRIGHLEKKLPVPSSHIQL